MIATYKIYFLINKIWLFDFGRSHYSDPLGSGSYLSVQNPLYYAGHLYLNGTELTDVVVPDGIENLSFHAFEGYIAMTSLVIPDAVKRIEGSLSYGFSKLPNLKSVRIGKGLESMVIGDCAALTSVKVGDGSIDISISGCPLLTDIQIDNAKKVTIRRCDNLSVISPKNINTEAFNLSSLNKITKLQISDNTSSIYVSDCPNLTTIVLGMGIKDNYNGLRVSGCKELTDVYNPMFTPLKNVTSYGFSNDCQIGYATLHVQESAIESYKATEPWSKFGNIVALKSGDPGYIDNPSVGGIITFADSRVEKICVDNWDTNGDGKLSEQEAAAVKDLGTVFKDNTQLVTFYELKYFTGLTAIADESFSGCTYLNYISIPEKVTSIGNRAFYNCANLKEILIPSGVTNIGSSSFYGCKSITEVVLPDNITSIGEYAFSSCYKLASLTLSKNLAVISNYAFQNCLALMNIDIPEGVVEIGNNAFGKDGGYSDDIIREQVTIPNSVKKVVSPFSGTTVKKLFLGTGITEESSFNYSYFEEIHVPNLAVWFNFSLSVSTEDEDKLSYRLFVKGSELENLRVPEGITTINGGLFNGCISLKKVSIPASVTDIGGGAFYGCSNLVSMDMPSSIMTIGPLAFAGCSKLTSIEFPERVVLTRSCFAGCTGLKYVSFLGGAGAFREEVFKDCSGLEYVVFCKEFPDVIGSDFFSGCTAMKDIYCTITTPPGAYNDPFKFIYESTTLHVPATAVNAYKSVSSYNSNGFWKKFANIVALQEGDPGYKEMNDVTLTAKSYTRKYGEANPTFEYTVSDGTIISGTPTITCSATATSPVGTYDIVISKGTVSNSGTVNLVKGTLTITKAPLTISAGNYTKKEGEDNPEFTPVFTGFKNNETKAVLTKQPTITTTATKASKAGNYTVSVSGAEAQNYSISYQTGTLTVTTSSTPVTNAEAYAVLSDDGKTVTFYYDDKKTSRTGVQEIHKYNNSNPYSTATKAVFDASFAEYLPTRTTYLFALCDKLTSITGMEHLNTANVTDMCSMFYGCSSLTSLDVSKFKTDKVKDMRFMFDRCSSLTSLDVSNFNTSEVTYMDNMFSGCSSLPSLDVSNFNTVNVTSMSSMFSGCSSLPLLDVSNFNTSNVTNMQYMFSGCSSLPLLDVSNFNTSNVTNMRNMFSGCRSLTSLDVSNFNTSNVTNMQYMFSGCSSLPSLDVSNFNTHKVMYLNDMFRDCHSLTSLDVSNFNTTNVTNIGFMFYGCNSLTSLDLSNFNTSNVKYMYGMFWRCSSLKSLDLSNFNTVNVTDMHSMFLGCSSLTSLDISNFNTSNVTNMETMFSDCSSLPLLDVSGFNTSNVTNMSGMFRDCHSLTSLDVSNFNTSNVTNMRYMFFGCRSLTSLDVCNFNTSNVTNMEYMFSGCSSLKTIYTGENWTTDAVTSSERMFYNCTALVGGVGTAYDASHTDATYARIDGGTANPGYFTDINAPKVDVTLTAKSYTREYGEANPKFEWTVSDGTVTSGTPTITCSATATSPVGTYDIVISKGTVGNNGTVNLVKGTLTITKAPLTIAAGNYTKEEGEDNPKFTPVFTGFKNNETEAVLTKQPTLTTTATKASKAGNYPVTVSSAEAQNYSITYENGTLIVTEKEAPKVDVTLTVKSYTREYGEANPKFEWTISDGTVTSGTPTITCSATATSPVGTYDIVISKGTVGNNGTVTLVNGTLTITKAPVTITTGNYTKEEGEDNPEFTPVFTGFKNNETETVLTKQPVINTTATKDSPAGDYEVTVSGAEAQNYSFSYQPGTLTVTAKPAELEPIEGETSMNTDDLRGQDLSDNVVGNIYYVVGENGYDASDQSIVISQPTNMSQIADKQPGSADVKENFNGMILKVAKGKGLITVNVKTSGNAQLVVQVGNGTPMLASKTEKGDVVFRYDVEEDTYVYIYAIIGSSAAKGYGLSASDTESSVRIYGITVSPGATGIRSIGASEKNDGNIYDLQGHRVETPAKGIYIIGGRKVAVK